MGVVESEMLVGMTTVSCSLKGYYEPAILVAIIAFWSEDYFSSRIRPTLSSIFRLDTSILISGLVLILKVFRTLLVPLEEQGALWRYFVAVVVQHLVEGALSTTL